MSLTKDDFRQIRALVREETGSEMAGIEPRGGKRGLSAAKRSQPSIMGIIVTVVATIAALVAVMAFAGSAVWEFSLAMTRLEDRLESRFGERLKGLEDKVLDVKEERDFVADDQPPVTRQDTIGVGESRRGVLTNSDRRLIDGSLFHDWVLIVERADTITIDMEAEDDELDSFLFLSEGQRSDSASWTPLDANDDDGEGLNARLKRYLEIGRYTVTANAYGDNMGSYMLRVTGRQEEESDSTATPPGGP